MISALAFVPRGAAKETPEQQELSAEEMNELIQKQAGMTMEELNEVEDGAADGDAAAAGAAESGEEDSDADMDGEEKKAEAPAEPIDDKEAQLLKELKMDGYEDEVEGAELFLGGHKLLVHDSNADDPYVTVPDHEDFDEEDEEDLTVKADDVMIVVAKTEEEASSVEVYLYEETSGNLYVHHDFNLPSFPLALCWMDCDPRATANAAATASAAAAPAAAAAAASFTSLPADSTRGSFLAVGTFQTGIEIWNLDVLDVLEPVAVLGGRHEPDAKAIAALEAQEKAAAKKIGGGKKSKKAAMSAGMAAKLMGDLREGSHADAVMSLAWHPAFRTRLASGSADQSVKLWDVCTQQCVSTLDALHSNKIQSIAWNFVEPTVLLSGAYDQTVCVTDVRTNAGTKALGKKDGVLRFSVPADIEQVKWSPHQPFMFAAALENGCVLFFDARQSANNTPLFTVSAHTQACTNVSFNAALPSSFLTSSLDKTVKVWDFNPTPTLVSSKDVKALGSIFAASFDVNYPHLLAMGGDKAKLGIWDMREDAKLRAKYGEECDGKIGRGSSSGPAEVAAAASAASAPSSSAAAVAAAAAMAAGPTDEKEKKKKKKKMKTSTRRVREDASDED